MKALINEAEQGKLLSLLKQKFEESMINETTICISIESAAMNCLNTILVESYEVNDEYVHMLNGDFEFTIAMNEETSVTYDNIEDCFKFQDDGTEIMLFF